MGFSSAGRDQGSTFYFELPLYSAASIGLDPEQAARTMLLSQNRLATAPMADRRRLAAQLGGLSNAVEGSVDGACGDREVVNLAQQADAVESGHKVELPGGEENSLLHPNESIASDEPQPVRFLLVVGYCTF